MCALSCGTAIINLYAKQLFGMEVCIGRGRQLIESERIFSLSGIVII